MEYRRTEEKDLGTVMEIIHGAQEGMRRAGIDQWQDGYPTEETILGDIQRGESRVWEEDGEVLATAMLSFAGEKSYDVIRDGEWLLPGVRYAVIHRIAVKHTRKRQGIAGNMLCAMEAECWENGVFSLRMDTHQDNVPMRTWLVKHHFFHCGSITLADSGAPREAYEKQLLQQPFSFGERHGIISLEVRRGAQRHERNQASDRRSQ